ncbi:MAG: hypothetical protein NVS1B7_8570 [Candidatus Saccharimonadales bacterium]
MKIVTSGSAYIDIDAYAGCIAEAELLNLTGEPAYPASSAPLNESIPRSLRLLAVGLETYQPTDNDEFIIIDISKEEFFDPIVKHGKIVEVIDHHPGQENYWSDRLGDKADIEFIGASCTQVFERWVASNKLPNMRPEIARLLAAGILDNTLNLQAVITTNRDRIAYDTLLEIGSLPKDFAAQYFTECASAINSNFEAALINDTKVMEEAPRLPHTLGQLTVWDAQKYMPEKNDIITKVLGADNDDWALNLISIGEGISYFISTSPIAQKKLEELIKVHFDNGIATSDRLWLRKELLRQALLVNN